MHMSEQFFLRNRSGASESKLQPSVKARGLRYIWVM